MSKKVDSIRVAGASKAKATSSDSQEEVTESTSDVIPTKDRKKLFKVVKIALIVFGVLLCLVSATVAAAYYNNKKYLNKAFPGVTVWGEDVTGKNFEEISKVIDRKIVGTTINLQGPDQNYTAKVFELGVMVNTEDTVLSALAKGRQGNIISQYWERVKLALVKYQVYPQKYANFAAVEPTYEVDTEILAQYINQISANINITAKDSQVTVTKGTINVVPAVFGREVNKELLTNSILSQVKNLKDTEVEIQTTEIKPNVIDKAAEEVKVQTESVISRPIILTFEGQEYRPNRETIASWISYTKKEGEASYNIVVDQTKMKNYFSFLGSKINIAYIPKKIRVENGVKYTDIQEGKDGRAIDERILGQKIAQLLPVQPSVNLTIPTYVVPYKTVYENVIVANWSKYIEVNIATQTMTAYLQGGQVVASWKITTGRSGWNTPTGTFLIQRKAGANAAGVCMPNPPSTTKLCGINYVSYFTSQGHAIHEAWWRTNDTSTWNYFGNPSYLANGSHGCVNAALDVAKFIYDWAPLGTPVIIH